MDTFDYSLAGPAETLGLNDGNDDFALGARRKGRKGRKGGKRSAKRAAKRGGRPVGSSRVAAIRAAKSTAACQSAGGVAVRVRSGAGRSRFGGSNGSFVTCRIKPHAAPSLRRHTAGWSFCAGLSDAALSRELSNALGLGAVEVTEMGAEELVEMGAGDGAEGAMDELTVIEDTELGRSRRAAAMARRRDSSGHFLPGRGGRGGRKGGRRMSGTALSGILPTVPSGRYTLVGGAIGGSLLGLGVKRWPAAPPIVDLGLGAVGLGVALMARRPLLQGAGIALVPTLVETLVDWMMGGGKFALNAEQEAKRIAAGKPARKFRTLLGQETEPDLLSGGLGQTPTVDEAQAALDALSGGQMGQPFGEDGSDVEPEMAGAGMGDNAIRLQKNIGNSVGIGVEQALATA